MCDGMANKLEETQLKVYKEELEKVNAKILDMTESGQEHQISTTAGIGTRVIQVEYTNLIKRQKQLLILISDLDNAVNGDGSRATRVI